MSQPHGSGDPGRLRVVAAMSGGVDSAVAAGRARDAGWDVTGVHLALTQGQEGSGCCTPEDARDARRAADVLGIPFYVWDLAARFHEEVVADFLDTYAAGSTPNPCVRCNERIKFAAVLDRARALGFDAVITGHHARLSAAGVLSRSVDAGKDQSYVLGTLRADQLAGARFPLGHSTKAQVRAEAAARGLAVADKPDSSDVCFVPAGGTGAWLRARLGAAPGPVVDAVTGAVLGEHQGAYAYTVGQRRGLGLPGGAPEPRYVLGVSPVTRTVTVGPAAMLDVAAVEAADSTYAGPPRACLAQLRAHGPAVPARAVPLGGGRLRVELHAPVRGLATGQAVVLYDGDTVLGGARVTATRPWAADQPAAAAAAPDSWASSQRLTATP